MVKKKSRTLAFILAASLIMPTVEGTVLAATNEESGVAQEVSNEATNTEDSNSTEAPEEKPIFESGDGKEATPYIINSLEQLKAFRDSVNTGNTYEGKYIKLTASVDLSEENWEPIGRGDKPFKGKFDGGSKEGIVVSNIKIEKELDNKARNSYVGLFGHLVDGNIKNLTINNATVKGGLYVSPVVGMGFTGNISNVNVTGDIKVDGYWYIGGISGNSYANISYCKVIASEGSYINATASYAGGIVGFRGEGNVNTANCQVENLTITGIDRLGGISGNAHYNNIIRNCSIKNSKIREDKEDEEYGNADNVGTIAGANQSEQGKIQILDCTVENTYAYLLNSDEPLTQKISNINHSGEKAVNNIIVGSNVSTENNKVTGGKFDILSPNMYDTENLKEGDIGNNQFILVGTDVVAMIGETPYKSIDDAMVKVGDNTTLRIIDDITLDKPIDLSNKKSVTIDFKGNTVNTSESFNGESIILLNNSDGTSIENANFNITKDAKNAIKVTSSNNVSLNNVDTKNSVTDSKAAISIENGSSANLSGKISSDNNSVVSVTDKSSANINNNLSVEGKGNIEINENSNLNISKDASLNLTVNVENKGTITNEGSIANTGVVNNKGTITNKGSIANIDNGKVNGQITNNGGNTTESTKSPNIKFENIIVNKKTHVATVTINNIKKSILGEVEYKIVEGDKSSNTLSRKSSVISQTDKWITVDSDAEEVTFTELKINTKYTIFARYKGLDSTIKSIVVDTSESTPSGGSGGGNYIPSKPTYKHEEIIGTDRYDTAAKIADKLGSYDNVVLVNAESSMSDGLSASGLAGKENGAILLTKKDSIPKATMDRIKKVKKVYIIGGEAAISQKVSDEITKNVPNVKIERLGGKDRVETSEIVAKKLGNYSDAFVVNGFRGEADAMSASAIAAKKGAPILLTNGKTSTHAKKSGVEYYVIGGNSVVDKSIADKYNAEVLAGKDRYATNKEVINEFYSESDKVYIANGDKLVDALTASPLAKKNGIVLVNEKSDKSILKGKNTVQVGGMDFKIEFEK